MSTSYGPGRYDRRTRSKGTTIRTRTCAGRSIGTCRRIWSSSPAAQVNVDAAHRSRDRDRRGAGRLRSAREGRRRAAARRADSLSGRAGRRRRADSHHHPRPSRGAGRDASTTRSSAPAPSGRRCSCRRCGSAPTATSCAASSAAPARRAATSRGTTRSRCSRAISTRSSDDPEFQLVVIATRHDEHADQVVRSLEAGKHVFVEKPLGDLVGRARSRRRSARSATRDPPLLMVGFNRRFSPALQKLQQRRWRPAIAAGDPVPAQRRLHPARSLGPRRAGRRTQRRRSVPHVRRVPVPRRLAGAVG